MKRARIGGQAVIEGVMMKYEDAYAVAVRKPDQEIEVKIENYTPIGEKYRICKLPVLRGIVNFFESLVIGVKTLTYSADFYAEEEETNVKTKKTDSAARQTDIKKNKGEQENGASDEWMMIGTVIASLAIAIALFMLLPAFLAGLLEYITDNRVLISVVEGVLRLAIFLAYVVLISLMEDIRRVFMYHGAEHKSINCFESGDPLTPENIKKHSRYHKRCGTSFLLVVMIVSIIVFMFIDIENIWLRLLSRVLLVPFIAGISYEFIMFAGKSDSRFAYIVSIPGMWLQRLTTREPDLDMIEVAIKSVEGVIDWRAYQDAMRRGEIED